MTRTSLVTGASRGIGRAIADTLAARGHRVIGLARSAPADGFPGEFLAVDLADPAATTEALGALTGRVAIDHLVNNAGLTHDARIEDTSAADLHRVLDVNLRAQLQCAQAVLPGMRSLGYGRIVNLGSRAGLGKAARTAYGAAKAGLVGMTRTWALELAADGVCVNCVAPGPIETEMFAANQPEGSTARQRLVDAIPMRRMGSPREVAGAVAFFLSDDAGFITGQTLYVCGGLSVGMSDI